MLVTTGNLSGSLLRDPRGRIIGIDAGPPRVSEIVMKYAIRLFTLVAAVSVGVTHAQTAALRVEKAVVSKSTFGSNDAVAGN